MATMTLTFPPAVAQEISEAFGWHMALSRPATKEEVNEAVIGYIKARVRDYRQNKALEAARAGVGADVDITAS